MPEEQGIIIRDLLKHRGWVIVKDYVEQRIAIAERRLINNTKPDDVIDITKQQTIIKVHKEFLSYINKESGGK